MVPCRRALSLQRSDSKQYLNSRSVEHRQPVGDLICNSLLPLEDPDLYGAVYETACRAGVSFDVVDRYSVDPMTDGVAAVAAAVAGRNLVVVVCLWTHARLLLVQ